MSPNARRYLLSAGLICSALCTLAENPAGENPGMENGDTGWIVPKKNFAIRDGAGRNGSRGLVWENIHTNTYGFAQYAVPFRPGQSLKVSLWIKSEGPSDREAGFAVELYGGKSNGYLTGIGGHLAPNQPKGPGVWHKYVAITGPIRPDTKICSIDIFVRKGAKGKCFFDDIEVETAALSTDSLFFSSAPDDRAVGGRVRLSATTYADLRAYKPSDLVAEFTASGKNGLFTIKPEMFEFGRAEAWLDVAKLSLGTQRIRFTVKAKDASGKLVKLDERRLSFTRLTEPVKARVWFDEHRRFVVDGKVTYPLLAYISGDMKDDPRALPAIDRSPIKMYMSYNRHMSKELLDRYQAHGVKVFASFCSAWQWAFGPPAEVSEWWDEAAFVARGINRLKDHPALLGWYLMDEPAEAHFPRARERYKLVKALDPEHPVLNVLCHGKFGRITQATCDVVGLDCYPVPGHGTEQSLPADLAAATRASRAALDGIRGDKPFWFVPQAFPNCDGRARFPTFREMRSMVWQSIACGADGVLFYSLGEMLSNKEKPGYNFNEAWDITCRVAQEIKDREAMLLSIEPAPVLRNVPKEVVARAWRLNGKTMLVLVNTTHKPVSGAITMDGASVPFSLDGDGVLFK